MNEQHKRAYRTLLYHAMLDIRGVQWLPLGSLHALNPLRWRHTVARIRRAGRIADWLHNLALYSALDFEGFDEARFWGEFEYLSREHPEFDLRQYQRKFEQELSEAIAG